MKLLSTRSGTYFTGSEIADAVVCYGLALSKRRDIDTINVPFLAADGHVNRVDLFIGWGFVTAAISDDRPADELVEIDTILDLYSKAHSIGVAHGLPFSAEDIEQLRWSYPDLD
jgi:hypothetical protein